MSGNMCIGIHKNDLIVRFNPKQSDELMKRKHGHPFDITGRPVKGWLLIDGEVAAKDLNTRLEIALEYVKTLPGK